VDIVDTHILGHDSRFEVDFNRPREKAVYSKPDDAWGLKVWKETLPQNLIDQSLEKYDHFYREVKNLLDQKISQFGSFIVYDLHSYNHRREGENSAVADPQLNPEINIGTGNMNREKFAPIVEVFTDSLRAFHFDGRNLDVRENIKFLGGYFSQWIHDQYPGRSCVLAIEVKKFFMDEWTGIPSQLYLNHIKEALRSTLDPVLNAFQAYTSNPTYGNR
jgi:N-formylglutamate deformylase